jgi:pimeloyl-ACP methyl ester carboxylesterase
VEDSTARTIPLRDGRRLGYAERDDPGGRPLLYFHGWPGSRVEGRLGDEAARAKGVRLIALDRPGMGLSDYLPRRTLVDWPDDVIQVAAALGLDRFAVLGISGGGPYAAVCAWKLSERLTGAGIVSGLAPVDAPGGIAGMSRRNRLAFQLAGRLAALRRVLMAATAVSVRRHPDRVLERGVAAAVDKQYLDRSDVRAILGESLSEAFRSGSRGPAWEMGLCARLWGFRLEDIRAPVHVWHGEQDASAPVTMGRYLATVIPECRASFSTPQKAIFTSSTACRRSSPRCVLDRPVEGKDDVAEKTRPSPPSGTRSGTIDRWPTHRGRAHPLCARAPRSRDGPRGRRPQRDPDGRCGISESTRRLGRRTSMTVEAQTD